MNFMKYHVSKNLCSLGNWTNTTTDTRDFLQLAIMCYHDDTFIGRAKLNGTSELLNIQTTGYKQILLTVSAENCNNLRIKHNGSARDILIDEAYGDFSGNYVISFDCTGTNPTIASGISLNNIMLNTGSTPLPYEPYSSEVWHDIPHYIHNTSTDTITTLPADIYANDTTATVGLKGNMEQSSQPSPTTPIQPSECGERTGNLWDGIIGYDNVILDQNGRGTPNNYYALSEYIPVEPNTSYIYHFYHNIAENRSTYSISEYDSNKNVLLPLTLQRITENRDYNISFTTQANTAYIRINWKKPFDEDLMLNTGSEALPYEPWGIKIPISSANTTTPVYLGQVESTRRIKKLVLTGQEGWTVETGKTYVLEGVEQTQTGYTDAICSHYALATSYTAVTTTNNTFSISRQPALFIHDDNYSSTADFKSYLQQQYAAGTPVTVWYVLATPETAVVNEPLRKIGDYADEVSGITIPTIAGANTLSVDTTLQPSEVTATYKGWHPVQSVHEYRGGWN